MNKFLVVAVIGAFLSLGAPVQPCGAGEIDLLLQKLVDKGILTGPEAQEVKVQTTEAIKKAVAAGKHETLPKWIQTMKMKGDLRLRYQYNHSKTVNDQTSERHRGRVRLRFGVKARVNNKLKVGFRLATGLNTIDGITKDAVRSTNQSFDDEWSNKPINLDQAYAQWTPYPWAAVTAGKMSLKTALWTVKDLMWDSDITPEGISLSLNKKINPELELWSKTGFFVIEESSSSGDDPTLYNLQIGAKSRPSEKFSLKTAFAYYYFSLQDIALSSSAGTNTSPLEDFSVIEPAFELKVNQPLTALAEAVGMSCLDVHHVSLFGNFVMNTHAPQDTNDKGFLLGFKVAKSKKVKDKGDWEVKYNFAKLDKDAVPDWLPDSDRYGGRTNIDGHEVEIKYGVGKNTWLALDIYRAQSLNDPQSPETLAQLDWNMKF
ncbi:MAG: putative porin [Candidatus Omnitrophica bacterium]|nr:putative porin [Candidatus Omnitrophota bacterium]